MKNAKIIRAMPNNPCLIGKGMIALSKGHNVVSDDLHVAEAIFKKVGEIEIVPEKWMDAVTGLSGSGPAFVYQAVEALVCGGVNAGLPEEVAVRLALHTLIGAAETVKITNKTPKELIKMVASPGGTAIEGLKILEEMGFSKALSSAVVAAAKKSKNLSLHGS